MSEARFALLLLLGMASPAIADGPLQLSTTSSQTPNDPGPTLPGPALPAAPSLLQMPEGSGPKIRVSPEGEAAFRVLKAFLSAPDWQTRFPFILHADSLRKVVQTYYSVTPDGPIPADSILELPRDSTEKGPKEFAFQVGGPALAHAVPARVVQTSEGYKVDWLMFSEFKDDLLLKYASSYHENAARFHVIIRRSHYYEKDVPDLSGKLSFKLEPPIESYSVNVFAEKGTPVAKELDRTVTWAMPERFAIVELHWRKKTGYQWLELSAVPQYDWKDPAPKSRSSESGGKSRK